MGKHPQIILAHGEQQDSLNYPDQCRFPNIEIDCLWDIYKGDFPKVIANRPLCNRTVDGVEGAERKMLSAPSNAIECVSSSSYSLLQQQSSFMARRNQSCFVKPSR